MRTLRTIDDVRGALAGLRREGARVGLVPTMGALHAGHAALIRQAREACDIVVASIFVNPTQFEDSGDLLRYPRDEAADARAAEAAGVDLLFIPEAEEMYPPGFDTWVDPGHLATVLEGAARPGHFRGVATICTKLIMIIDPDVAYFGRKDAQQVAVVRQVARDLHVRTEIVAVPTVRDADGLALSSRNVFLTPEQRRAALALPRSLEAGASAHRSGDDPVTSAQAVLDEESTVETDYLAVADFDGVTLAAAIRVGATRLIDNVLLEEA